MRRWIALGAAGVLVAAVAVLYVPAAGAATSNVSIVSATVGFSPSSITINVGDTVKWTNNDTTTTHTVTSTDSPAAFDSGNVAPQGTFSHTFNAPGDYPYHCSIHTNMTGSVSVQGSTSTTGQATTTTRPATTTTTAKATTTSSSLKPTTTSSSSTTSSSDTTETTEEDTTTSESTTTTIGEVAAGTKHKGGGAGAAAALIVLILAVAGAGGFAVYRLRMGR